MGGYGAAYLNSVVSGACWIGSAAYAYFTPKPEPVCKQVGEAQNLTMLLTVVTTSIDLCVALAVFRRGVVGAVN